jgi:Domain of unknown function (DUF4258)
VNCTSVRFSRHAIERMAERSITVEDVRTVLTAGEIIAEYPEDLPWPTCLLLGHSARRPLHVLAAVAAHAQCVVVTVYEPDPALWSADFRRRTSAP